MAEPEKTTRGVVPTKDVAQAESMLQLGLAIPAGCFAGMLLGYWLDKHFGQHWMTVAGLFLGAAGGFVNLFLALARMSKRGDE